MPPGVNSRYQLCAAFTDDVTGKLVLTDREPYGFQALADNRQHVVAQGDTLAKLAARYFDPIPDAALLWWVIADFQPDPIFDPTIALVPGQVLIIPSVNTVLTEVFDESRSDVL
jgi:nucleoid-associated protein YgaU